MTEPTPKQTVQAGARKQTERLDEIRLPKTLDTNIGGDVRTCGFVRGAVGRIQQRRIATPPRLPVLAS